jgi:arylsulfatase A-like enzyme
MMSMDWLPTLLAAAGMGPDLDYPPDGENLLALAQSPFAILELSDIRLRTSEARSHKSEREGGCCWRRCDCGSRSLSCHAMGRIHSERVTRRSNKRS